MTKGELHVISTGKQTAEKFAEISRLIHPYVTAIHIREKTKTAKEIYNIVSELTKKGVPLKKIIINDRVDVAYTTKVKGVQLAYHSLTPDLVKKEFPSLRVGCSVHSIEEAKTAQEQGADYLLYGHIFPTDSKQGANPRGIQKLTEVTEAVEIPLIAIGGIKPGNLQEVMNTGAGGIAVMSGVFASKDPLEAVKRYSCNLVT